MPAGISAGSMAILMSETLISRHDPRFDPKDAHTCAFFDRFDCSIMGVTIFFCFLLGIVPTKVLRPGV